MPEAYPKASTFIRDGDTVKVSFDDIVENPKSKDNFVVFPGDNININVRSNTIEIKGQVNAPGIYKFYENYSLNNYINIAGGLTMNAEKNEIWISYPDGISKQQKYFFTSPKVYDGSIISIGIKEEEEPFDATEYAKEVTSIISNFVQILLLYNAINN